MKKSTKKVTEFILPPRDPKKPSVFGDRKGEKFGGGNAFLSLEQNEVVHDFVHVRIDEGVDLGGGNEPINLHVALDPRNGEEIRMPASAVFRINAEKAKLSAGDVYSVARDSDTIKKKGKGKGKEMQVWEILVTKRYAKKS